MLIGINSCRFKMAVRFKTEYGAAIDLRRAFFPWHRSVGGEEEDAQRLDRQVGRKLRIAPHMPEYESFRRAFSWAEARKELDGLPGGRGLNIAHEAVDRHAAGHGGSGGDPLAGPDGAIEEFTFRRLSRLSNRFANVLAELGVAPGERVYVLTGRIPALYIAALGSWKYRTVFCTLFSAFGPEPIRARMAKGDAKVLVTTQALYDKKVAGLRASLPSLKHVLIVGEGALGDGTRNFDELLQGASEPFTIAPTDPEDMALLHFTSGTTGTPKGAMHVHQAVVAHHITGKLALDLHPDDIFWCTADPGWVTGTSYGIIAPLTNGVTSIVDEADFDAERWYDILTDTKSASGTPRPPRFA